MLHLEAPEPRTFSGFPAPVAQSAPNKLGTPHSQGVSDSLLGLCVGKEVLLLF